VDVNTNAIVEWICGGGHTTAANQATIELCLKLCLGFDCRRHFFNNITTPNQHRLYILPTNSMLDIQGLELCEALEIARQVCKLIVVAGSRSMPSAGQSVMLVVEQTGVA
jgi:hypothetical protein